MFANKVQPSRQVRRAEERAMKKLRSSLAKMNKVERVNPIRKMLLDKINIALTAHQQREEIGDQHYLHEAMDFNAEYIERSSGHGRHTPFIKSVALEANRTTTFPRKYGA